jgi:hypothetical protein
MGNSQVQVAAAEEKRLSVRPILTAALISFLLLAFAFPKILFLQATPMASSTWGLQDPPTSSMVFIPGKKAVKYETQHSGQMLWTNLQGMGLPLLGQEIQVAPLFPLTILLSGLPDLAYWNVFALARLFLTGLGTLLIATELLSLSWLGAAIFTISFTYGMFSLRWINHPFLNGMLAGVWEIYFLWKAAERKSQRAAWDKNRIGILAGLTLSFYSLLCCGFPESTTLFLIIAFFVTTPVLIQGLRKRPGALILDLGLSHLLAIALASPQLFALFEFLHQTSPNYRAEQGLSQLPGGSFLSMITRDRYGPNGNAPLLHHFNLIPIFLFLLGLVASAVQLSKSKAKWDRPMNGCLGAALCAIFFVLKVFPIWPAFNVFWGSLPVLKSCWFTVYFLPLFLWSFAYFAAVGASRLFSLQQNRRLPTAWVVASVFLVLVLFVLGRIHTGDSLHNRPSENRVWIAKGLLCFTAFLAIYYWFLRCLKRGSAQAHFLALGIAAAILAFAENELGRPHDYVSTRDPEYRLLIDHHSDATHDFFVRKGISTLDYRERSENGDYLNAGIATLDMGASAIIPERLRLLRVSLFSSNWDGYLPLKKELMPYSYALTSAALYAVPVANTHEIIRLAQNPNEREIGFVGADLWFQDKTTLSRAYLAKRCIPSSGMSESQRILTDPTVFSLGAVIVEDLNPDESKFCANYKKAAIQMIPIESDQGKVVQLSPIQGPAILVLNDNYYPGWKVIDQKHDSPLEIKHANLAFRAVILPDRREYNLKFEYRPPWLRLAGRF